ncbi:hypothetical protein FIBSPDRAFT_770376, partial [Athelia psychrophila]
MIASLVPRHIFLSLVSRECTDITNCRTFWQIVQPSVTALFAANYLSVHGNISRPNLPWYRKAYGSVMIFLVALIFPDWIFMWAIRSWITAFAQKYGLVHTFYVLMGGVHVHDARGIPLYPLDIKTTGWLIQDGHLLLPTEEEIMGLGRSTSFGRAFAALQLLTFLTQCALRFAKKSPLANFEVMAFAHASIAVLTFFPWWYKPMDV